MRASRHDHADDVAYPTSIMFVLVHLGCLAVFWVGMTERAVLLGVALYLLRMFAITAGYHRYFAHRSFRTGRAGQLVLALLAQMSGQRGVLWWASMHRRHHKYADTTHDVHSPRQRGFLYAHAGWIFVPRNARTDYTAVQDLSGYAELRWLDRHHYVPIVLLGVASWLAAGWPGVVVGFCWSTVAVWHATFSINSLAHLVGRQRYVTGDDSRNNWLLALLTLGEGWHNNHHAYQVSARQGFRWWEYDPTYYVLRSLSWLGLVWDLRFPPQAVIRGEQKLGRVVIDKVACQLAASLPINHIAQRVHQALMHAPATTASRARLTLATAQMDAFWSAIDLPEIPTLDDIRSYARARLAQTPSLEEIAVRARQHVLELVYSRLNVAMESGIAASAG